VFSNVKSFDGVWKDTPNFVVTTREITGDWSEPIYLNSSGFDGSFFHDGQKTWYTSMLVDHRDTKFFGGIILQEYCKEEKQLIGEVIYLTEGTKLGLSEGPHLYKKDKYYYLLLAEGGTEYNHAATILRSKSITGPFEEHPGNPILSSKNDANHPLQKAGHASLVKTQFGDWYIVFLLGRPLTSRGRCVLGRETGIEEIIWEKDWPYLKTKKCLARVQIPNPKLREVAVEKEDIRDDFDTSKLSLSFQSLRIPKNENWISLIERPGFLRLKGKESLSSTHTQALIARRLQHFDVEVSTCIEFEPKTFQQLAGLVVYYNTGHYHYFHVTRNKSDKILSIISSDNFSQKEQKEKIIVTNKKQIVLKAIIQRERLQFSYSFDDTNFKNIGNVLDMSILSDDYVREASERYRPAFTGCFVGLCCQDLMSNKQHADFDWFSYKEL
jgi:xylan 1,4-beta-xylosidase